VAEFPCHCWHGERIRGLWLLLQDLRWSLCASRGSRNQRPFCFPDWVHVHRRRITVRASTKSGRMQAQTASATNPSARASTQAHEVVVGSPKACWPRTKQRVPFVEIVAGSPFLTSVGLGLPAPGTLRKIALNLLEYLQKKYQVDKPTTMMACEGRAFGVPYPLQSGWLAQWGAIEMTPEIREKLIKSLSNKRGAMCGDGLRVLGVEPTRLNQSAINRKLRRKERRAAKYRELGKSFPAKVTRYYQPPPPDHQVPKIDPNSPEFLLSYEWRSLRMKVLAHYGSTCMCCGATRETGAIINVDHIRSRKVAPGLALAFDNLQVLCDACNHGKSNWDETDWRPKTEAQEEFDGNARAHLRLISKA
jgi:5-methylcytosine-specific restriction endonuclease McrA